MSKIRILLAAALIFGLSAATLRAAPHHDGQTAAKLDVLVDAIRSNRKALVAVNLKLTDEEAAKFWPVYDRYQKEINAIGDRLLAVLKDYSAHFADLSDELAAKLVSDYLAVDEDRVKVKRVYLDELNKVLPGRKVARFYQIENKMDAVIRYDLAATIPVVEDEKNVPAK